MMMSLRPEISTHTVQTSCPSTMLGVVSQESINPGHCRETQTPFSTASSLSTSPGLTTSASDVASPPWQVTSGMHTLQQYLTCGTGPEMLHETVAEHTIAC